MAGVSALTATGLLLPSQQLMNLFRIHGPMTRTQLWERAQASGLAGTTLRSKQYTTNLLRALRRSGRVWVRRVPNTKREFQFGLVTFRERRFLAKHPDIVSLQPQTREAAAAVADALRELRRQAPRPSDVALGDIQVQR